MWADPYDLAGLGAMTAEQIQTLNANYSPEDVAKILASQGAENTVAVSPTTETQAFNLANTVAKGLLDVYQTQAQTKLSTAQTAAAAEAFKVQSQNYVMQQLQQGKQVMVPQSWLEKYATSDTATKWLTPILIIGGVGLLGYALWKYSQKSKGRSSTSAEAPVQTLFSYSAPTSSLSEADASMAAANPRRKRSKRGKSKKKMPGRRARILKGQHELALARIAHHQHELKELRRLGI